jgi:hypothetical protein
LPLTDNSYLASLIFEIKFESVESSGLVELGWNCFSISLKKVFFEDENKGLAVGAAAGSSPYNFNSKGLVFRKLLLIFKDMHSARSLTTLFNDYY